jgi:hypothetical protein
VNAPSIEIVREYAPDPERQVRALLALLSANPRGKKPNASGVAASEAFLEVRHSHAEPTVG